MRLIDSHSHIDFSDFDSDRNIAIQRALDAGVSNIVVSSTVAKRWSLVKTVCVENPNTCHPAYGLHPMFMDEHQLGTKGSENTDLKALKEWLNKNEAIAVGEIGLDFFIEEGRTQNNQEAQIALFVSQLEIANDLNLPVIVHARKSLDIVLKHLRKYPTLRGSIHSFSGSEQQAKQLIDLGFYLSFGGPITYSRATRLQKLIKVLPLESLLIESDSPDQADSTHYLERNEPAFIINVAKTIAEIKQLALSRVAEQATENAKMLFGF